MTRPASSRCRRPGRLVRPLALLLAVPAALAAEFEVTVLDRYGEPVPGVAVYVESNQAGGSPPPDYPALMRQTGLSFDPELLVIQTGTRVRFPNLDDVAHHVYSFSKPNNFVLPMFKGGMQPQVAFEHPGVVAIGCNLHDHMVAYILVVDSPVFGKTGIDGSIRLEADNPAGLTIRIWNPRLDLDHENLSQSVKAGRSAQLTFPLVAELRSDNENHAETLRWKKKRIR